ncbi:MAG: hypothetical protein CM15mP36_16730 [Flavobacteriales bacterium]|nr:MAG: hypothetical protein CM15mP36_16730 [Flavobacteriales bacterium]
MCFWKIISARFCLFKNNNSSRCAKIKRQRIHNDETFNQQISIADILVGNKSDLYNEEDKKTYWLMPVKKGSNHLEVLFAQNGVFPFRLLEGKN